MEKNLPEFYHELVRRNWMILTGSWARNETLLREFFAQVGALSKEEQDSLSGVTIRDTWVPLNAHAFDDLLGLTAQDNGRVASALRNREANRTWAVNTVKMENSNPTWAHKGKIYKTGFNATAVAWNIFVANRLMPSKNYAEASETQTILIAAIMSKWPVDVGEIVMELREKFSMSTSAMPFPGFLTSLFEKYKVPALPSDRILPRATPTKIFQHITSDQLSKMQKSDPATSSSRPSPIAPLPNVRSASTTSFAASDATTNVAALPASTAPPTTFEAPSSSTSTPVVLSDDVKQLLAAMGSMIVDTNERLRAMTHPSDAPFPQELQSVKPPKQTIIMAPMENMLMGFAKLYRAKSSKEREAAEAKTKRGKRRTRSGKPCLIHFSL
ncbi:PREDICTED: uncharacterized protein LOC109238703 [Nicotiana attenuata]|uniref:uncharacterized protein LOC109238703 n=1 Tax=Nicotiana attenuata TaxID=49451 RepID=UPI000904D7DD|nr:PREDICTED: uncharacterized protein LOC109238703 [Nicotiana attenuata]